VNRLEGVKRTPIIFLFSKTDLFNFVDQGNDKSILEHDVNKLGFGERVPPPSHIDDGVIEKWRVLIDHDFSEIIKYFKNETKNFHIIFGSSFCRMNGNLLGVNELLKAVLG